MEQYVSEQNLLSSTSLWLMSKNSVEGLYGLFSTSVEFLVVTFLYWRLKTVFADKVSTTVSSDLKVLNI